MATTKDVNVAVRVDEDTAARIGALVLKANARTPGGEAGRSTVLRAVIARGLPLLEAELGEDPAGKKGRAR